MELSKSDTKRLKGIGILLMVLLHLFTRKEINGLYETFPMISDVPLVYYFGLMGDACRPIYLFVTGYAFFLMFKNSTGSLVGKNLKRILKLYINLWIVMLIFIPVGFLFGAFKSDALRFFLNFSALSNSYNGAWWFVQIYIIIVLISPFLIKITNKYNSMFVFLISGVIYFITYVQRFKEVVDFGDHPLTIKMVSIAVLLGTSQFSFMVGSIFAKEKLCTKIYNKFNDIKFKNSLCFASIIVLMVFHGIVESAIIAPINGILFICLYMLFDKNKYVERSLDFISNHSTNIWLTHMFFYMTLAPDLIFAPKYPILIYIWLIAICIAASYVINWMYKPIVNFIDRKSSSTIIAPQPKKVAG